MIFRQVDMLKIKEGHIAQRIECNKHFYLYIRQADKMIDRQVDM